MISFYTLLQNQHALFYNSLVLSITRTSTYITILHTPQFSLALIKTNSSLAIDIITYNKAFQISRGMSEQVYIPALSRMRYRGCENFTACEILRKYSDLSGSFFLNSKILFVFCNHLSILDSFSSLKVWRAFFLVRLKIFKRVIKSLLRPLLEGSETMTLKTYSYKID